MDVTGLPTWVEFIESVRKIRDCGERKVFIRGCIDIRIFDVRARHFQEYFSDQCETSYTQIGTINEPDQ